MGSSRRNGEGRREPRFGPSSSLVDLRLGEDDRVRVADPKPAPKRRKAAPAPPDDEPDEAPPPRRAARSKTRGKAKRERGSFGIGRLIYWGAVLGLWGVIAVVGLVIYIGAHLPPIQSLEIPKRPPTIQIVGSEGTLLATRGEMAGANVALKDLPPYLPKAFIAIEDRRFYSHFGIDPMGIVRAAVANVLHRGVSQGGSTLTQQLAKNLFLTQERTMQRKLQEAELAIWLERKHSKNEILELYLNRVYFGSGAYGVEAAAQRYFGKSARNVTIAEAAMLAGLVKSPSRLAPNRNPEGAERRAQTVLTAMADAGFITDAQAKANLGHPSYAVKPAGAGTVNYVADWVADVLDDLIGQIDQNITVETTIDPKLQSVAEAAIIDELAAKSVKFNVSQGALVAMTPNGEVRAMVGGRNYADSQFNRAVTARRQPGSAFKPFVYLTAMEQGLTPDTIRQDGPLDIKGWKPENYTHEYFGSVTLTQALAMSLNTVAVRVGLEVGPKNVVRTAHRLGIASKLDAWHLGGLGAGAGRRLRPVRQRRPWRVAACHQPHPDHRGQKGAVCPPRRSAEPGDRAALCRDDGFDDAGDVADRHGAQGRTAGVAGRRQDRHQPGFPRRLVYRLHRQSRHRRVARQRRQLADQEGHRRRPAGGSVDAVHAHGASERAGGDAAELRTQPVLRARQPVRRRRADAGPAATDAAAAAATPADAASACRAASLSRLPAAAGQRRRTAAGDANLRPPGGRSRPRRRLAGGPPVRRPALTTRRRSFSCLRSPWCA